MTRVFTVNPLFDPQASAASANLLNLDLEKCPDFSHESEFKTVQVRACHAVTIALLRILSALACGCANQSFLPEPGRR
jgi:hypothetical protein